MSKSTVEKTIAQAKEMGLELSADGKSWVEIEELVVKLPPEKSKVHISVNKNEGDSALLKWIIYILAALPFIAIFVIAILVIILVNVVLSLRWL